MRLALSFALATLVLVAGAGVLFERSFRHGLEHSLDAGLRAQSDALATQVREQRTPDLGSGTQSVASSRDVVAQVLTPAGRVVSATVEAGVTPVVDGETVRAAGSRTVFVDRRLGAEREHLRVLARAVSGSAGRRIVVVATSLESTDDAVGRVRDALLVGGSLTVVLAGIGGFLLSSAALRPVERMRRDAASISANDSGSRVEVPATRDEIALLAVTINELLGRLQGALDRQRAFVADAGHELRTPLAVLRAELELAGRRERSRQELLDAVDHAAEESERLSRLAEELLFLARADDDREGVRREAVELGPLVGAAVDGLRARAEVREVVVTLDAEPGLCVEAAPDLVRRAVENLLENALRYAPGGSTIVVRARAGGSGVGVQVLDEGPGFPDEFLPHAFERFSRADESRTRAGGGSGLGLAIVLAVARAHGGTAEVANRAAGGAVATIRIPGRL
jgi:heavy metal sensor kinase